MAFGGYDVRAGHAPSFSRVLADSTRTRARVFSLPVLPAAGILGLQGVPSQAPGSRASHCTVEGVFCDHGLASVIQARLTLAADIHSEVRAATSRSSASWGQLWGGHRLERAEEGHWRTSPHPERGDRHTLWVQAGHKGRTPGASREGLFSGWRQKILWEEQVSLGLGGPLTDLASLQNCSDLSASGVPVRPWGRGQRSTRLLDEVLQVALTQLPVQLLQLLGLGLGHTGPSGSDSDLETNAHSLPQPRAGGTGWGAGPVGSPAGRARQPPEPGPPGRDCPAPPCFAAPGWPGPGAGVQPQTRWARRA